MAIKIEDIQNGADIGVPYEGMEFIMSDGKIATLIKVCIGQILNGWPLFQYGRELLNDNWPSSEFGLDICKGIRSSLDRWVLVKKGDPRIAKKRLDLAPGTVFRFKTKGPLGKYVYYVEPKSMFMPTLVGGEKPIPNTKYKGDEDVEILWTQEQHEKKLFGGRTFLQCYQDFITAQRNDDGKIWFSGGTVDSAYGGSVVLNKEQLAVAQEEWSRQLRIKVQESEEKDKLTIMCDGDYLE